MRNPKYKSVFSFSDDNLGISSGKMPQMGEKLAEASRSGFRNECSVFRHSEDVVAPMEDTSPPTAADAPTDSRREPDPASRTPGSNNDAFKVFDGEQLNWLPLTNNQTDNQGQEVHHTLQDLVLGPRSTYSGPGDPSSTGYGNSGSSNGADAGLSPDTGHSSSNRPTPNSTTPSEPRPNLQAGQNSSGVTSYETSPASAHQARVPTTDGRAFGSFFSSQPDYSSIPATGLTPENTFSMPETPGRDISTPSWEMGGQTSGLTPIGDGVFRHLYGLGPMGDLPMDLGWEGNP